MPPAPRKGGTSKPRLTYGRQRSFLDQDEVTSPRDPAEEPRKKTSLSRTSSQLGAKDVFASDSTAIETKVSALKASHELREAGQSHRFRDEVEYILDGIRNKGKVKIRRTSCMELSRSMLKQDFARQIRAHHYLPTIFDSLHEDPDPIVLSCLVLMIGLVLRESHAYKDSVGTMKLVVFLCKGLAMDQDPMATMPSARSDILMYNEFKDLVRQSGMVHKGQKVLTKSILLSTITSIVNDAIIDKDTFTLSIMDTDPLFSKAVVDVLVEDLAWIKEPTSTAGVSLADVLDIYRIENCLRTLERLSLVSKSPSSVMAEQIRIFPLLVQLIILCRAHAFQYPQQTDSLNLMLHVLRLLINVTNDFEPCCDSLAKSGSISVLIQNVIQFYGHCRNYNPAPDLVGSPDAVEDGTDKNTIRWTRAESRSDSGLSFQVSHGFSNGLDIGGDDMLGQAGDQQAGMQTWTPGATSIGAALDEIKIENDANGWYDILLLSIGLLINMLESNPLRRSQVTDEAIGLECQAAGDCLHAACTCEKSTEALEKLVDIYNTEATISEMTENQVLAAYLALLLGCVVGGNIESETRLYEAVNGNSLVPMLDLLNEFSTFHQRVQEERLVEEELAMKEGKDLSRTSSFAFSRSESGSFPVVEDWDEVMMSQHSQQLLPGLGLDGDCQGGMGNMPLSLVSFSDGAAKALETQRSFVKIMEVLQDIETRHSLM